MMFPPPRILALVLVFLSSMRHANALCRPSVAHFMRHHERFLEPTVEGEGSIDSVLRAYGLERARELPLYLEENGFSPDWTFVTQLTYSWQSSFPVIAHFSTPVSFYDYQSPGGQSLLDALDALDGTGLCPEEVLVMSHGPGPGCTCPPPIDPDCVDKYYVDVMARTLGYTGPILIDHCKIGHLYTLRVVPGSTNATIETRIRYEDPPPGYPPTFLECRVPTPSLDVDIK